MNQVMSRFLQWAAIACRDERLEQIFIFLQVDILIISVHFDVLYFNTQCVFFKRHISEL